jgi:hypothetical protein
MKTISVKLPAPLAEWLTRQANDRGQSRSALVREALEQQRKGNGKASCHDLLGDLCGSLKGPRDLSTNPKYLEGLGK